MRLDDVTGHIAAVVALCHDAFVARNRLAEGVLAAHKKEEHFGRLSTSTCSVG